MTSDKPRRRSTAQLIGTVPPRLVSAAAIAAQPERQPLDEAAAVVYGKFINAAYDMFEKPIGDRFHPLPRKGVFPEGYQLTAWIRMSDIAFFGNVEKQFYGFIATETNDPHSHVIVVRGTETPAEWFDNAMILPVPFNPVPEAGYVHIGFYSIYHSMRVFRAPHPIDPVDPATLPKAALAPPQPEPTPAAGSFADQVEDAVRFRGGERTMAPRPDGADHVIVTGHSLGGALCTLYVMEHAVRKRVRGEARNVTIERLCTFASPRVGLGKFAAAFDKLPIDSWRLVNTQDLVPMVPPPFPVPFRHVDTRYAFSSRGWVRFSPVCWHSMLTYMHWLDPKVQLLPGCVP